IKTITQRMRRIDPHCIWQPFDEPASASCPFFQFFDRIPSVWMYGYHRKEQFGKKRGLLKNVLIWNVKFRLLQIHRSGFIVVFVERQKGVFAVSRNMLN